MGHHLNQKRQCCLSQDAKYSAFGPNLSCLHDYLDNKYNFPKSGFVRFQYIWQNDLIQKTKKIHGVDLEKNASQTDRQVDKWMDEQG